MCVYFANQCLTIRRDNLFGAVFDCKKNDLQTLGKKKKQSINRGLKRTQCEEGNELNISSPNF